MDIQWPFFINKMYDFGQIFIGQTQKGTLGKHSKKCRCQNNVDLQKENILFWKLVVFCCVPN